MKEPSPVLIVDDDPEIRTVLYDALTGWGYQVIAAENGREAWDVLRKTPVWLVISDWMMPGMDGLDLCRHIRSASFASYVYIILLTAKTARKQMVEGMEAGADDFMIKPFILEELRARIAAAERILRLEQNLEDRNRELSEMNESLRRAHEVITRDLEGAAWIQQSLLPTAGSLYGFSFESLFIPCRVVGGDIFSFFPIGPHHVAFYSVDVSGHGIPAAMLSVTVSKTISSMVFHEARFFSNLAHQEIPDTCSPATVAKELNLLFKSTDTVEQYFTMVYGVIDRRNGNFLLTQAGHPYPILAPARGMAKKIGSGGLPVGLLQDAEFTEECYRMAPGDRLFLYSDGITDCTNDKGELFGSERLVTFLSKNRDMPIKRLVREIGKEIHRFHGGRDFEDDLSLMAMEMQIQ